MVQAEILQEGRGLALMEPAIGTFESTCGEKLIFPPSIVVTELRRI